MLGNVDENAYDVSLNLQGAVNIKGQSNLVKSKRCHATSVQSSSIPCTPASSRRSSECRGTPGRSRRLSLLGTLPNDPFSNVTITTRSSHGLEVLKTCPDAIPLDNIDLCTMAADGSANEAVSELEAVERTNFNHPQYTGSRFDADKPPCSYATLIAEAIIKSPEQRLTLSSIYDSIRSSYPYYQSRNSGWQNSIRHNLSLNKCFERIEKTDGKKGKGSWWTVRKDLLELEGDRAIPKSGCIVRKKVAKACTRRKNAKQPLDFVPINQLQHDYALDGLYVEVDEDCDEHSELVDLCAALQNIHSASSSSALDCVLQLVLRTASIE